jgi:hypothetical protein
MKPSPFCATALAASLLFISSLQAAQQVPEEGSNLGAVTGGKFKQAHLIIDQKCTKCHDQKRIEQALASGKDLLAIQHRMEMKGVRLSADERKVLGIFWQRTPLKTKKP